MSPLHKHVIGQFLSVFLTAWGVMTLAIVVFDGLKVLTDEGLTPRQMAAVFPYLLPSVARTAMQGAVLFAACCVYGQMAAKNELLALNAAGISVCGVIWPAVALGIPLSFACVCLEDVSETWSKNGIRRVICEGVVDIAYAKLRTDKTFTAADYELTVRGVEGRVLIRPTIANSASDPDRRVKIEASFGQVKLDERRRNILVNLKHGSISIGRHFHMSFLDEFVHAIPLARESSQAASPQRIHEQEKRVEQLVARIQNGQSSSAAGSIRIPSTLSGDSSHVISASATQTPEEVVKTVASDDPVDASPKTLEEQLREARMELSWSRARWHQKWANSFCCLTFTLIGIPVAVRIRRADYLSSFMACFLPLLAVYQPVQWIGMAYATRDLIEPAWLHANNVVIGATGVGLLLKMFLRR